MNRSPITTHVLDTSKGKPAAGIRVRLYRQDDHNGMQIGSRVTDADGRVTETSDHEIHEGVYRLHFEVADYFAAQGTPGFYPFVDIVFSVQEGQHYHVPLLLNPFGYSTYRGS